MVLVDSFRSRQGRIEIRGLPEDLTRQAMEAVRQEWRFKKARDENGQAVTTMAPLDVIFRLR
jgi:hypothetical protein